MEPLPMATQAPAPSLIQFEARPGGVLIVHVQAGVPTERRAAMLLGTLEHLPAETSRIVVSFAPGTDLCCTSLWAISGMADRCAMVGGSVGVCGLGDLTLTAARQAGLLRRFIIVDHIEHGVEQLLAKGNAPSRTALRWLRGQAA